MRKSDVVSERGDELNVIGREGIGTEERILTFSFEAGDNTYDFKEESENLEFGVLDGVVDDGGGCYAGRTAWWTSGVFVARRGRRGGRAVGCNLVQRITNFIRGRLLGRSAVNTLE